MLDLLEKEHKADMKHYQYLKNQSRPQQNPEGNNITNSISTSNSSKTKYQTPPTPPRKLNLYFPSLPLCTDNGAMVAWTAVEKLNLGISDEVEGQEVIPKWPLGRPLADVRLFKKPS